MKFRIEINQKEIIEAGIKGVKIQEWLLFDVVRHMIGADWTKKIMVDEKSYAWISEQSILDQIPLLELSKRQVHRLVDNLVEAGLLVRYSNNMGMKRVYLGLTPIGDSIGRHSLSKTESSEAAACQKRKAEIDISGKLSLTEVSGDYKIKDNPMNNNLSDPPSQAKEEKAPKISKDKKKLTRKDATEFYENEEMEFLKAPVLPPDLLAAAAARKLTTDILLSGYHEIVDYMMKPSDMWPNGMWSCVLTKPNQLGFLQFCKLILNSGMTRVWIKDYLNQWENKKYDNDNLYATFVTWWGKQSKSNGGTETQKQGLPPPKQILQ